MSANPSVFLLRNHPIFSKASAEALLALSKHCEVRHYRPEQKVAVTGFEQTHVLVMCRGSVSLHRKNKEADTQMLVGIIQAPAVFGDAEFFSGYKKWIVSAEAIEPTEAVAIPNEVYRRWIEEQPKVAAALYADASARHFLVINLMQVFALQKTTHKILRLLYSLRREGESQVPLRQVELADALGMNRRTISRHLDELESRGLIRRTGRQVELVVGDISFSTLATEDMGASWRLPLSSRNEATG
jgi:CRP-like cAMP-binding protein